MNTNNINRYFPVMRCEQKEEMGKVSMLFEKRVETHLIGIARRHDGRVHGYIETNVGKIRVPVKGIPTYLKKEDRKKAITALDRSFLQFNGYSIEVIPKGLGGMWSTGSVETNSLTNQNDALFEMVISLEEQFGADDIKKDMAAIHDLQEREFVQQMVNMVFRNDRKQWWLNLEKSSIKLSPLGTKVLAKALEENVSIQYLNLSTIHNIGDEGAKALAWMLSKNQHLRHLDLQAAQIGDEGAKALAWALQRNKSLLQLNLLSNHIGDVGAVAFGRALETNRVLQRLVLSKGALFGWRAQIGNVGAIALARGLENNQSLQELGLMCNQIGDEGIQALAKALETNSGLQKLNLRNNKVRYEGARTLACALSNNRSLLELDLSAWMANSNQIGPKGGREFGQMLQSNETLQVINLQGNSNLEMAALAKALETNRSLQKINLAGTTMDDEGALLLATGLQNNHTLRELTLLDNPIAGAGKAALLEIAQAKQDTLKLVLENPPVPRTSQNVKISEKVRKQLKTPSGRLYFRW